MIHFDVRDNVHDKMSHFADTKKCLQSNMEVNRRLQSDTKQRISNIGHELLG